MSKRHTPAAVTFIFVLAMLLLAACDSYKPTIHLTPSLEQTPSSQASRSFKLLGVAEALPVSALAWSSDGKLMAVSDSHGITLSDGHTLQEIRRIETPYWVKSLAFSPDGKWLVGGSASNRYSGAPQGSISVWVVATGRLRQAWAADGAGFVAGFQSDGQTLVTEGYEILRLWNVTNGQFIREMSGSFLVSPDFKHAFGEGALWNLETNTRVLSESSRPNGMAFSPDGRWLALTLDAQIPLSDTIQIWNVASGQLERTLNGPWYSHDLAFSLDGRQLAVGGDKDVVQLWDVETGQLRQTLPGQKYSYQFAFSPDGTRLAVADAEHHLRWWNTQTGQLLRTAEALFYGEQLFYNPDGYFLVEESDEALRLWDAAAGKLMRTFYNEPLEEVAFTPDDQLLLMKPNVTTHWHWDQTTQQLKLQNTLPGSGSSSRNYSPRAISPDGTVLAVINLTATIQLIDTQTGQTLHTLKGYSGTIISLAFSRDSAQLISSARLPEFGSEPHGNGELRIWDVRTGQPLSVHEIPQLIEVRAQPSAQTWLLERFKVAGSCPRQRGLQDVALYTADELLSDRSKVSPQWVNPLAYFGGLAVSADGRVTAVATQSWGCVALGPVQVWDTQTGALLTSVSLNQDTGKSVFFTGLALNPDGSILAFGADDGSLATWDVNSGRRLQALSGLTSTSKHLLFSPDGQLLISGNQDGQIQVWEVRSGQLLQTLGGHTAEVTHLVLGHQGRFLISGSADGTARLWDLGEDHLPH